MKRTLALILCVFATLIFVSCATTAEPEVFDFDFNSGMSESADLGGYEMIYLFNPVMNWAVTDSAESYLGFAFNTPFADAAQVRVDEVEKNLNCKIEVEYRTVLHDYVKPALISGYHVADLLSGISDMWGDYCRLGLMLGMSEVSNIIDINDEAKWGCKAFLESMYYENDLYGVVPSAWPDLTYINFGYPLVFNASIVNSFGLPDPREYVENNQWDWDRFYQCVQDYTLVEGTETKYYGLMGQRRIIAEMFIHSNGSEIVNVSDNGTISYGLFDAKGQRAIDAARELVHGLYKECVSRKALDYNYDALANAFCDEECTMAAIYTGYIYGRDAIIGQKVYDFGILSWPHGPDVDDDYTFSIIENIYTGMCIPYNCESPEATAIIMDALYEPLEGFETRAEIRDYMSTYYFFDSRDADVFFKMYDNCKYNYFHWFDAEPVNFLIKNQSGEVFISENEESITELFTDGVVPIVNGIIATKGAYNYEPEETN